MMYGEQPHNPEFSRAPPPPSRQPSASSTNLAPDFSRPPAPYEAYPNIAAYGDSFAARRMRKVVQRRAVDYTSTVVRYMQVTFIWSEAFFFLANRSSFAGPYVAARCWGQNCTATYSSCSLGC
ncbi:hypothetical protein BHM03_00015923 [Ensete ventricosum]|nr:hypothetical protein BHM03_00015923 [Ensete ventricosum]